VETQIFKPVAAEIASPIVSNRLRIAGVLMGGSLLVSVCSHIAVPLWFTPVPLTLQPFAVLLLGLLLSPSLTAATLGVYLLEGVAGLPVFAPGFGFGAGIGHILGPTGGYLLSYPASAALVAWMWRRTPRSFASGALCAAAGDALILLSGFAWLAVWTHSPAKTALTLAVLPFLPGDALKVIAAAGIAKGVHRVRRNR
jgi:biotin transport system substrate-specific component